MSKKGREGKFTTYPNLANRWWKGKPTMKWQNNKWINGLGLSSSIGKNNRWILLREMCLILMSIFSLPSPSAIFTRKCKINSNKWTSKVKNLYWGKKIKPLKNLILNKPKEGYLRPESIGLQYLMRNKREEELQRSRASSITRSKRDRKWEKK